MREGVATLEVSVEVPDLTVQPFDLVLSIHLRTFKYSKYGNLMNSAQQVAKIFTIILL